jgi:glucose/arabinose dehydrogenase
VNPESAVVGPGGKLFVTAIGEFDKDRDGGVYRIEDGKPVPFVSGLDDPKGIAFFRDQLYVADKTKVLRVNGAGKVTVLAAADAFPKPPLRLNDVCIDPESGTVYVSDSGDTKGAGGAVYRLPPRGGKAAVVADPSTVPGLHTPNGIALDGQSFLMLGDYGTGVLYRVKLADRTAEKVADGFGGTDGVVFDHFGRLFVSDHKGGKLWAIPRPGAKPVLLPDAFQAAADIALAADGRHLLVPDMKAGTVTAVRTQIPGAEVDDSPIGVATTDAFPSVTWTGWSKEDESGRPTALRPIVLTHAGDGSNRVFVAEQHGVIHVLPNDPAATATKVFLDIRGKVRYNDKTNEEGFLGLAFHPKYKQTGEFFVFYTPNDGKMTNIVSRFRVSKDDPDRADPGSEEVLLRYENRPFWNHDGGTVAFGPDGLLYAFHGDGGAANDPFENGQKLSNWFGKILRIDVDAKEPGKPYAVPKDNPFVGREDAKPEIFAYGLRNVWRMSFDRATGKMWAADVGQNLFEEINLVTKGGNYGWNRREGLHPFGAKGVGPRPEMTDPIWEYHHDVGKSITGGFVYRGKGVPALAGHYIYGDYVSAKVWALKHDEAAGRVVANRPWAGPGVPILSWGEDEAGEAYLLTTTPTGRNGLLKLVAK